MRTEEEGPAKGQQKTVKARNSELAGGESIPEDQGPVGENPVLEKRRRRQCQGKKDRTEKPGVQKGNCENCKAKE